MNKTLKGNNCLIIGATGNIGRGAAKAFLQHGAERVIILGRQEHKLMDLARDYLDNDDRLLVISSDLSTPEGAQTAQQEVKSEAGMLHCSPTPQPICTDSGFFILSCEKTEAMF
jgi:short-subunit dehydrogenase